MITDAVPLGEIADVLNGYAFKSKEYVDSGIRIIRITNVQKGCIKDDNPKFIEASRTDEFSRFMLDSGDILISLTGNVGRVGVLGNSLLPAALNQRVGALKVKSDQVLPEYLFHLLNSDAFERAAIKNSKGIAQLNLSSKWVEQYSVPLPPLSEQKRIAGILDAADELRAKRREALAQLDTLLQATFLDMFGDPVTNPKGWEQLPFTDVCDIQGGTQPPKSEWIGSPADGYIRMLQIRDFTQAGRAKVEYVKDTKRLKKCASDDILIGRYGASVGKILTGLSGAYNVAMAKCRWDESRIVRAYLLTWLQSDHFLNKVTGLGGRAAQAGFNKSDLKEFLISVPPIDLQEQFASFVQSVERQKPNHLVYLAELDTLFASLQQRAFAGEL